jgi:hypothetical protein
MKKVFAVSVEDDSSGAVDWYPTLPEATTAYESAMGEFPDDEINLWAVEVEDDASNAEITNDVDAEMWEREYTPHPLACEQRHAQGPAARHAAHRPAGRQVMDNNDRKHLRSNMQAALNAAGFATRQLTEAIKVLDAQSPMPDPLANTREARLLQRYLDLPADATSEDWMNVLREHGWGAPGVGRNFEIKPTFTDWFPGTVEPVRSGVYQLKHYYYAYFDAERKVWYYAAWTLEDAIKQVGNAVFSAKPEAAGRIDPIYNWRGYTEQQQAKIPRHPSGARSW